MKNKTKKLTFKIRKYKNGEWVAQCKEIEGIITGGKGKVNLELIYNAVITAFGYQIIIKK